MAELDFDPNIDYIAPSIGRRFGLRRHRSSQSLGGGEGAPVPTADIQWTPSRDKFHERASLAPACEADGPARLPKGWPGRLDHARAWHGGDLSPDTYTYTLSVEECGELHAGLAWFKGLEIDLRDINKQSFPLGGLGRTLEELHARVLGGLGFVVIRGHEPSQFSREDNAILYMGVSAYFGDRRGRQAQDGQLMGHVADVKLEGIADEMRRPLYTSLAQPYHTDLVCGILAMCFLGVAEEGGQVLLSSAWTVYNEIAATRPDIIEVLSRPDWVHDTFGRRPAYHRRALLHRWNDKIALVFSRRTLTGSEATPRTPSIPGMTAAQAEALDVVHFTADEHRVAIDPCAGDMFFINNLSVLHSRTAFRNDGNSRRYALRLWLDDAKRGWGVPPGLRLAWERVFGAMPEVDDFVDIDPYAPRGRGGGSNPSPPRPPVRSTSCG